MAITKETKPYALNLVWGDDGKLRGAAFYEQHLIVDDGVLISTKQGEAQPIAILGQKGIDTAGLISKVAADALALAEEKDAALKAAEKEIAELKAGGASTKPPEPAMRVATVALLFVLRKRGLREQLEAAIASLPAEQATDAAELMQMPYTRRDHPLVAMAQQAFGWTDAQVDELFAEADAL